MSKISTLVLGLVSGAAMFGAIQYASGNDLRGTLTDQDKVASSSTESNVVNRSAKGDRAMTVAGSDQRGQTLSFRVHGVNDTSILVRLAGTAVPPKSETIVSRAVPASGKPEKAAVACEPPVSMLTDVAKLLQPGRCVT
jgi:VCBS repeat-containing protein